MTWGRGYGTPWGGGPLIPVEQPLGEISGDPTTFDFSDEADGPLPGNWEAYALEHDGAGGVAWSAEPTPDLFFRVVDGLGFWDYTRAPTIPGPADPFSERGFAAAPRNVLEGRNARVRVIARQPVNLLDSGGDELRYSVGVALRLDPASARWVGARMRARWVSGTWVEPLVLEIVQSVGGVESILATEVPPALPSLTDIWRNQLDAEIEVEVVGTALVATVSGVIVATAQVPGDSSPQVAIMAEIYNRKGSVIASAPAIVATQFQSLRDFDYLGPPPQIPGALHLEAPDFPMIRLPLRGLLDAKLVKQLRGRQFEFLKETEVVVQHQTFRFDAGEVVRAHEKLSTQEFTPVTRDLHITRSRKHAR